MKYYLAMKSNGVQIHAMTWMNLENSTLRERKPVTKGHIVHDSMFKTGTSIDRE